MKGAELWDEKLTAREKFHLESPMRVNDAAKSEQGIGERMTGDESHRNDPQSHDRHDSLHRPMDRR